MRTSEKVFLIAIGASFLAWVTVNGVANFTAVTAGAYTSTAASGANGFACSTNGCRVDYGSGASDYCDSDGTSITCHSVLQSSGNMLVGAGMTAATGVFSTNGTFNGNGGNASVQVIGAKNDGAGAIGVKIENSNALTAGVDRDSCGFYSDSGATLVAEVTSNGTIVANTLRVPVVHGSATNPQAIEHGSTALVAGTKTITFATAFTAAPDCFCSDATAIAACDVTSTSTTQVILNGTATDTVKWLCIGDR